MAKLFHINFQEGSRRGWRRFWFVFMRYGFHEKGLKTKHNENYMQIGITWSRALVSFIAASKRFSPIGRRCLFFLFFSSGFALNSFYCGVGFWSDYEVWYVDSEYGQVCGFGWVS